ncbi:MAG: molecular chaperone DjlA [Rhodospirillaceae bacterium]|nr:molecular chaperone DjlA [Rhodospirillaceae bacterium]
MSMWGKVIGSVAGFAVGGPLGALLGAAAGHALDRSRAQQRPNPGAASIETRQTAFTIAVIVLSAKMAKADGTVTRDEINTFKTIFNIPSEEMPNVGRLFDEARQDAEGFEPYAAQMGEMFTHNPAVLESLLSGLFEIALADGVVQSSEMQFLEKVAQEFRLERATFERIKAVHMEEDKETPYQILGVSRNASDKDVKSAYRTLIRENHPDKLIAQGMPQDFIDLATEKMARINGAYEKIERERALS